VYFSPPFLLAAVPTVRRYLAQSSPARLSMKHMITCICAIVSEIFYHVKVNAGKWSSNQQFVVEFTGERREVVVLYAHYN
jgi:hypothetical protein